MWQIAIIQNWNILTKGEIFMRLYEPIPVTERGLWAMLLHPTQAIYEIIEEQRQLKAFIRKVSPGMIHPMRDWNLLIILIEDIWKRPIKTLKLFIKVRRCGIYKAVESELEDRGGFVPPVRR